MQKPNGKEKGSMLIKNLEQDLDTTKLLSCIAAADPELYEDDAEELLNLLAEADAVHPGVCMRALTVTQKQGAEIWAGGMCLSAGRFEENCKVGDQIYPCLMTAGKELTEFSTRLTDPLLGYLMTGLLGLCLDDGLIAAAGQVLSRSGSRELLVLRPGVEGMCEFSQRQILELLGDEAQTLQVTVGESGLLTPAYSSTALFFLGKENRPKPDLENRESRRAFLEEMNRISGHV